MISIRDIIKRIIQDEFGEMYGVPCTVIPESVDLSDPNNPVCDCQPINGDAKFLDVRLKAGTGNGVLMIPTDGSVVLVQPINEKSGYISMFSSIESIKLLDGSFGGLVKVEELVGKINGIENTFNAHVHTAHNTPTATTITPITTVADIENDKITHGTT